MLYLVWELDGMWYGRLGKASKVEKSIEKYPVDARNIRSDPYLEGIKVPEL